MRCNEGRTHRNKLKRGRLNRRGVRSIPCAFTLIEAMVAIALTTIAGSALLFGTTVALQRTDDTMRRAIACGLAEQLMDEITGFPYDPNDLAKAAGQRQSFKTVGDFNGYASMPPTDSYGVPLGTEAKNGTLRNTRFQAVPEFMQNWRQEVAVYYPTDVNLTTGIPADQLGVVEVRIVDYKTPANPMTLVKLQRVVVYAPSL